jgi:Trypsin-like peptidase domain
VKVLLCLTILWLSFPSSALGNYLTGAEQLSAEGAKFTWSEAKSKSLKILLEYQADDGSWSRADLGSGFLISPDGLFVTAYHVMKYCLEDQEKTSRFSESVDCSNANPRVRYKAQNDNKEFEIQIISHLRESDSTNGKNFHTPDEIIKHRDFLIGRLKADPESRFSYWPLSDFAEGAINLSDPRADFELKPLLPPKRVFIVGYPKDRDFEIAHGFLNLTEENRRGYFAADYRVYAPEYLESQGISPDTKWGMGLENHMSGGAVVDASGYLVGLVVNGNRNTAAILSIENVLETFFSRSGKSGPEPSIILTPTKTPLYLRESPVN